MISNYIYFMNRYCLALDLKDDPASIAAYDHYHKNVWPEISESIRQSGIRNMEIYRTGNRLFMIMEVEDDFSFEKKAEMDRDHPKVQEWNALMWTFLQPVVPGEKDWILMEKVFGLND